MTSITTELGWAAQVSEKLLPKHIPKYLCYFGLCPTERLLPVAVLRRRVENEKRMALSLYIFITHMCIPAILNDFIFSVLILTF